MSDDRRNKLIQDFEQLSKIQKPFDREDAKNRRAQQFEAAHGLGFNLENAAGGGALANPRSFLRLTG